MREKQPNNQYRFSNVLSCYYFLILNSQLGKEPKKSQDPRMLWGEIEKKKDSTTTL